MRRFKNFAQQQRRFAVAMASLTARADPQEIDRPEWDFVHSLLYEVDHPHRPGGEPLTAKELAVKQRYWRR